MPQPTKNADANLEREIGLRIMLLRGGESQAQLAEAVGVSREIIQHWERGSRHIKAAHLIALAEHFHVTTDYLLGMSETKTNDRDVAAIGDYTGLDVTAIRNLNKMCCADEFPFINRILSDYDALREVIQQMTRASICSFMASTAKRPLRVDEAKAYNDFRQAVFMGDAMYEDETLNKRALAGEVVLSPSEAVGWYANLAYQAFESLSKTAITLTIQDCAKALIEDNSHEDT